MGVQEATCVLVGVQIGAKNVPLAKKYARVIFIQAMLTALVVSVQLYVFRNLISTWFTNN